MSDEVCSAMRSPHSPSPEPQSPFIHNITRLNIFAGLKMALFPMAIITLFWKDQIGLSLTEILLLQAIFSLATLVLEFPSGYLSDRLGYRFALHLASLLGITGWTTYTLASTFSGVLLAEIQLGISYAFISGADSALLYETLRAEGRETDYTRLEGRMTAWAQAGEATGAIGAGVLYAWFPLLPFILQIAVWIAALRVCRGLRETPAEAATDGSHWQAMKAIASKAFRGEPGLRWSILLAACLGLASFYPVWLIQPFMQARGVPLAWFGPFWALANLSVSLGSISSHRVQFHCGPRGMLAVCLGLFLAGYGGLAFSTTVWGCVFYLFLTVMRGLQGPFLRLALQKQSTRSERASILSLKSFVFRLGFVVSGPAIGVLADRLGLASCFLLLMIALLLLLVPLTALFHRATRQLWYYPSGDR